MPIPVGSDRAAQAVRLATIVIVVLLAFWYIVANHTEEGRSRDPQQSPKPSASPSPSASWQRLPAELVATLRAKDPTRLWEACEISGTIITCPDGYRLEWK